MNVDAWSGSRTSSNVSVRSSPCATAMACGITLGSRSLRSSHTSTESANPTFGESGVCRLFVWPVCMITPRYNSSKTSLSMRLQTTPCLEPDQYQKFRPDTPMHHETEKPEYQRHDRVPTAHPKCNENCSVIGVSHRFPTQLSPSGSRSGSVRKPLPGVS